MVAINRVRPDESESTDLAFFSCGGASISERSEDFASCVDAIAYSKCPVSGITGR